MKSKAKALQEQTGYANDMSMSNEQGKQLREVAQRNSAFKRQDSLEKKKALQQQKDEIARQSQMMWKQLKEQQMEYDTDQRMTLSRSQTRRLSRSRDMADGSLQRIEIMESKYSGDPNSKEVAQLEQMQDKMQGYLSDIQERVLDECAINKPKWNKILQDFVRTVIDTVKPQASMNKNSMDICKYVKIQLIEYKDTSKCRYVNGVVIKKGVAHRRMAPRIDNPKMIIIANSLGYMKDDEDFVDLEAELRQESTHLKIILDKISHFKPNLIITQKDISQKCRDELVKLNVTCIKNVKKSVIDRIERLTKTPALPNINLLS